MATPLKTWLVWQLRKVSYRWWPRYEVWKKAKVSGKPNTYVCAGCDKEYVKVKRKRILALDHIVPCKDPSKPGAFQQDLETCQCGVCDYLRKMFCQADGMQVLCKKCHDLKTKGEMSTRKVNRRKKKEGSNG